MSKEAFFEAIRVIIVVTIIILLVATGVTRLVSSTQRDHQERCAALGKRLGYETELILGRCYLKVRPGLKIREDQVLDFLPVIGCR